MIHALLMNVTAEAVNPARAGMIPRRGDYQAAIAGKPRASGDDPVAGAMIPDAES